MSCGKCESGFVVVNGVARVCECRKRPSAETQHGQDEPIADAKRAAANDKGSDE